MFIARQVTVRWKCVRVLVKSIWCLFVVFIQRNYFNIVLPRSKGFKTRIVQGKRVNVFSLMTYQIIKTLTLDSFSWNYKRLKNILFALMRQDFKLFYQVPQNGIYYVISAHFLWSKRNYKDDDVSTIRAWNVTNVNFDVSHVRIKFQWLWNVNCSTEVPVT